MAFNGSGTFVRTDGTRVGATVWEQAESAAVAIVSDDHDVHDQDIADGLTSCVTKDGQSIPTANLPMGGFLHTNVGDATARTNYAKVSQIQDSGYQWGGTSGGAANVQTISVTPAITAYVTGQRFRFISGYVNTGPVTINVNGVGAKSIAKLNGQVALVQGDMQVGQVCEVVYDGTYFVLMGASSTLALSNGLTTISNTVTETNLFTYTIPANVLGAYRMLQFHMNGDFLQNAGGTVSIKAYFGTTLHSTLTAAPTNSATRYRFGYDINLQARDATNQNSNVIWNIGGTFASANGVASVVVATLSNHDAIAENSANALEFRVTGQNSAASVNLDIRSIGSSLVRI